MEMPLEQQKPPDISPRRQANELIKLIRKLRWMGMEEETERAETAPRLIGLAAHYSLPAIYQWREFPAEADHQARESDSGRQRDSEFYAPWTIAAPTDTLRIHGFAWLQGS